MKGVIFNVVEEVVTEEFGADTWDALLDATRLEGAYTALGNYDDAELAALVAAAASALGVEEADVLRLVGRRGFAGLAGRYPHFLEGHTSSRSVLGDLNEVIHPQVLALYPGANVPEFGFVEEGDRILLDYHSARGLCHLAEGLALGAIESFREHADITQETCRHRGDESCRIILDYRDG